MAELNVFNSRVLENMGTPVNRDSRQLAHHFAWIDRATWHFLGDSQFPCVIVPNDRRLGILGGVIDFPDSRQD